MIAATLMGVSTDRLAGTVDPAERLLERLRIDRAFTRWMELREAQANLIANEVARRFGAS